MRCAVARREDSTSMYASAPASFCLIEGYAARFNQIDMIGDTVRPGAFRRALAQDAEIKMLLQHVPGASIGRWSRLVEDGLGLFVRGVVENDAARALIQTGLNGLSIGFHARLWSPTRAGGRRLAEIDLVEISLVAEPMQRAARFEVV